MDYDSRPRALILESGCYDPLSLWPEAPLRTKLQSFAKYGRASAY